MNPEIPMQTKPETESEALTRASVELAGEMNFHGLVSTMVDQAMDITRSDVALFYSYTNPGRPGGDLEKYYQRGRCAVPDTISAASELIHFVEDCGESVLLLDREPGPFTDIFLNPAMQSGIALPVSSQTRRFGMFILNSREPLFYGRRQFYFLESQNALVTQLLHNSECFLELEERLLRTKTLERDQRTIFSSMTDLLIALDQNGYIHYFNDAAKKRLGLDNSHTGKALEDALGNRLSGNIFSSIRTVDATRREIRGIEGVFQGNHKDMDCLLSIFPRKDKHGTNLGLTLLLTDRTGGKGCC